MLRVIDFLYKYKQIINWAIGHFKKAELVILYIKYFNNVF